VCKSLVSGPPDILLQVSSRTVKNEVKFSGTPAIHTRSRLPVYMGYNHFHPPLLFSPTTAVAKRLPMAVHYTAVCHDGRQAGTAGRKRVNAYRRPHGVFAYLFARSCLPEYAGCRSLPAVAYQRSGTPAQVSGDSESAAPESAFTIVVDKPMLSHPVRDYGRMNDCRYHKCMRTMKVQVVRWSYRQQRPVTPAQTGMACICQ